MRRGLWILGLLGVAALVLMMVASQSALRTVGGVDEALELQDLAGIVAGTTLAAEPPPRVTRSLGDGGWSWRLEAALRPGAPDGAQGLERALGRLAVRMAMTRPGTTAPTGVSFHLRTPAGGTVVLHAGPDGRWLPRPAPAAPSPSAPSAPPAAPAAPPPGGER